MLLVFLLKKNQSVIKSLFQLDNNLLPGVQILCEPVYLFIEKTVFSWSCKPAYVFLQKLKKRENTVKMQVGGADELSPICVAVHNESLSINTRAYNGIARNNRITPARSAELISLYEVIKQTCDRKNIDESFSHIGYFQYVIQWPCLQLTKIEFLLTMYSQSEIGVDGFRAEPLPINYY